MLHWDLRARSRAEKEILRSSLGWQCCQERREGQTLEHLDIGHGQRVRRRPGKKSHGKGAAGGPKCNLSLGEGEEEEEEGGGLVKRSQELQGNSTAQNPGSQIPLLRR